MSKNKNEDLEKSARYAALILSNLSTLFDEENEGSCIREGELSEDNNLTHFFHALMNLVPTHMYNNLAESDTDVLGVNHVANKLCVQYRKK
ncbi:hypothetical protein [Cyclobacterium marinum]|uniref:hypothetical protein n=1 Tax=Cyclobacterium marinum TaxID=104 RepID=UPI0030DC6515|tara:strand:- start:49422 stop:49694 length:273 start_codon:yes stop_codon:yes gene_type:complete